MTQATRRAPFGNSPHVGQRGATTRRKILDAALAVFDEHGYYDTRIELITSAAGCSRPSFYQYFSSKEEVYWTLAGELAKKMSGLSDSLAEVDSGQPGVAQLQAWLDEMIDLYQVYAAIFESFLAATSEASASSHGPQIVAKRLGHAINTAIKLPGGTVPDAVGSITVTLIVRSIHFWRLGLGQLSRERFVDGLAQTLHRLVHGPTSDVNLGAVIDKPAKTPLKWPRLETSTKSVSRPRARATRQKLLTAGANVLQTNGYHETHVDDIVNMAGVSHGSFYHYFASKDALFQELAESATLSVAEVLALFPEQRDDEHVHQWLEHYFSCYRDIGGVISVWREIKWDNTDLDYFAQDVTLAVIDRLRRIIARRDFGDDAVDALVLMALVERVPHNTQTLEYSSQVAALEALVFIIQRALFGR